MNRDKRPSKAQSERIAALVAGGLTFEAAWAQTMDRQRIPVAPFLAAIRDDERSPLQIATDAGLHPDRTRMLQRQKSVSRATAGRLCDVLHIDPYEVGL